MRNGDGIFIDLRKENPVPFDFVTGFYAFAG